MVGIAEMTVKSPKPRSRKSPMRKGQAATTRPLSKPAKRSSHVPRQRPAATLPPNPDNTRPPESTAEKQSDSLAAITHARALQELVRRVNEGCPDSLVELRKMLDAKPEIWRVVGDAGALAERQWIELLACGKKLAELSIPRRLRALKADLTNPDSSSLEKMLIDVIGVTWLASQHGEFVAAQTGGSIQQAAFRQRR